MTDVSNCKQWRNEVNWDMIHEDAITLYLEWGNNNYRHATRSPVTKSGEYSIYFAIDTWEEPKMVLMRMDNFGSQILCSTKLPDHLREGLLAEYKDIKGILELTPPIKKWAQELMDA
ncbi:DVU0772 family protein [Pseudodesulfovibrio sp. zrk46]|uniref:DVU0772 family protein n=1 Tax=Pseudodesulfovibrio sp. zrk46 TaxID=2725288 RepID=UPI001449CB76|nr:hypothetical protein [Pseudodesulfovibrio sp. zrk46]QJB55559.1 hypothetical protein HFN16_03725 [Pseudodesulfovibrio sp. zrk46]